MLIDKAALGPVPLAGKVAVVTGAGQGIGRETARVLARLGARVALAELRASGEEAARAIRAEGGEALFVATDVADPASVERLRARVAQELGEATILVNNAEAFEAKPLLEHSVEEWDRVFAVNLRGAFLTIRAFLPEMLARRDGVVVTMRSADGMPYLSAYLASKVGLRSLALSLAGEVGDGSGVSVFCLGPGMADTPGIRAALPRLAPLYGMSEQQFIEASAPGGELMSAEAAATGLVGAILHARDFHGQEIDSIVGLQRLGLDARGEPWDSAVAAPASDAAAAADAPAQTAATPPEPAQATAAKLCRELEATLRTVEREYDALSIFMRPIVKRMFQQGAGAKLDDWIARTMELAAELERGGAGLSTEARARFCDDLARLGRYFASQEKDARGYFREPAKLEAALQALRQRQEAVAALSRALR